MILRDSLDTGNIFKKFKHNCIIISCWDSLPFNLLPRTCNKSACWWLMASNKGPIKKSIRYQPSSQMALINAPSPLHSLRVLNKRPGRLLGCLRYMVVRHLWSWLSSGNHNFASNIFCQMWFISGYQKMALATKIKYSSIQLATKKWPWRPKKNFQ